VTDSTGSAIIAWLLATVPRPAGVRSWAIAFELCGEQLSIQLLLQKEKTNE